MEELKLNTIEEAIADFREGKFVIVVDDEDRENEGDFICAAEFATTENINCCCGKNYSRTSQFHAETCAWRTLCTYHYFSLQGIGITSSSRYKHVSSRYSFHCNCG